MQEQFITDKSGQKISVILPIHEYEELLEDLKDLDVAELKSADRITEDKTISIKQRHRIKLPDTIILATAITNQIELLTLDKKLANKII